MMRIELRQKTLIQKFRFEACLICPAAWRNLARPSPWRGAIGRLWALTWQLTRFFCQKMLLTSPDHKNMGCNSSAIVEPFQVEKNTILITYHNIDQYCIYVEIILCLNSSPEPAVVVVVVCMEFADFPFRHEADDGIIVRRTSRESCEAALLNLTTPSGTTARLKKGTNWMPIGVLKLKNWTCGTSIKSSNFKSSKVRLGSSCRYGKVGSKMP